MPKSSNWLSNVQDSKAYESSSRAASNFFRIGKKVLWHTGKAAWIAGTSVLVLVIPLIIEMDREQQMADLESGQLMLGGPQPPVAKA